MKKIVMSAAVLAAVITAQAQASMAVCYGFNQVYGDGKGYNSGKSVSMIYNQPVRPGTFVNFNVSTHQVFNNNIPAPDTRLSTDYNVSFDLNVSLMQAIHDNAYLEAGLGTIFNDEEIKPFMSVGGGLLIMDTKTAKVVIDMKAGISNADNIKSPNAGRPDLLLVGQFRLFMPFDNQPVKENYFERYHTRAHRLSRFHRPSSGRSTCYSL
jgi:hypothetical protein